MARAHTKIANNDYISKDNFYSGDIHRLVTIGTPHLGSKLADYLLSNEGECFNRIFNSWPINKRTDLGAVKDLTVDSEALQRLNNSSSLILVHTIVGISSEVEESLYASLLNLMRALAYYSECDNYESAFPGLNDPTIFGSDYNDLIVSAPSQSANGSDLNTISVFPGNPENINASFLVHSTGIPFGTAELESNDVFNKVVEVLNSDEGTFRVIEPYGPFSE